MDKENRLRECVEYFKENPAFDRIFLEIKDKYKSLGKVGGMVKIDNLTMEEKETFSGYLKTNYYRDSANISLLKFEDALNNTPFEDFKLPEILEGYFNKEIITRKERFRTYEEGKKEFFNDLLNSYNERNIESKARKWLEESMGTRTGGYRIISRKYDLNPERLRKDLNTCMRGIDDLPIFYNKVERLALFASRISKNPHSFDENTDCGKLLLYGISHVLEIEYPGNSEETSEALFKAGLIKDEISNFTISSALLAYKDGKSHLGWEGFYNTREPLHISLWNLSKVDKVLSKNDKVFIFENPTVFSEVLNKDYVQRPSLICTYGQVKLAALVLMDKLVENGAHLYYSGDFDPEGLTIADKLKSRYKENLILWRYNREDYNKSISKKKISQARINKMKSLKDIDLISVGELIEKNRYAGYQESIIGDLIGDIENLINKI